MKRVGKQILHFFSHFFFVLFCFCFQLSCVRARFVFLFNIKLTQRHIFLVDFSLELREMERTKVDGRALGGSLHFLVGAFGFSIFYFASLFCFPFST